MYVLTPRKGSHSRKGGTYTGAAWLSSARAVKCRVKSLNERNPCRYLLTRNGEDSSETAGVKPEEGGDDVKSSWPLCLGLHTCYNGMYRTMQDRKVEQIAKAYPSSDCGLKFARMKLESLVIADQLRRGEYVPEPCTHRPSSHGSWQRPKSPKFMGAHGEAGDWD